MNQDKMHIINKLFNNFIKIRTIRQYALGNFAIIKDC